MGNYETLSDVNKGGFFVVVASHARDLVDASEKGITTIKAVWCVMREEVCNIMKPRTSKYFSRSLCQPGEKPLDELGFYRCSCFAPHYFGFILLISVNFDHILKDVESQVEITAYLEDSISSGDISRLDMELSAVTGVKEVKFISKEKALEEFMEQVGKDLLEGMENPLPNSFRVKVDNPQEVAHVAGIIQKLSGIDEVKYGKGVVEKLFNIIYWVRLLGLAIMIVFAAISIFIISNTIRLTVFARRREISIMKYIGATDWFVRWPFLIEGMVLGLVGSAIAVAVLAGGYNYLWPL